MSQMKVINKRNGKVGVAQEVKEGLYTITYEDGTAQDIAEATFNRWFKLVEEASEQPAQAEAAVAAEETAQDAPETEKAEEAEGAEENEKVLSFEEFVAKHYPNLESIKVTLTADKSQEEAEKALEELDEHIKDHYKSYLKDLKRAKEEAERARKKAEQEARKAERARIKAEQEAERARKKAALEEARAKAAELAKQVSGEFRLISHNTISTNKGSKTVDVVGYGTFQIVITEYGGYITDVRVLDEAGNEVYRSPKMSLRDVLSSFFGFDDEKFKIARSTVTALRKEAAKAEGSVQA